MSLNVLLLGLSLLTSACGETKPAETVSVQAPQAAKTVSVEVIDLDETKTAAVHVGDTLQVTIPVWTGTSWKVVGEQPTGTEFVSGYLGPGTDGMKYTWKVAGSTGTRTIKFIGTDANDPMAGPSVITVNVKVI